MLLHHPKRTRLAWHLAAIMVVLATAFAYSNTRVHAQPDESPLLVNTRSSFRICAQVAPGLAAQAGQTRGKLAASLRTLRQTNPTWNRIYGATSEPPTLESGCATKLPHAKLDQIDATAIGLGTVTTPTPFRTVFLVLDDATADTILGPRKASLVPYEMMRVSEHDAVEVTSGLVVRESALADPEVVQKYMSIAVGLMPTVPMGPPAGEQSPTLKPENHDAGS